MTSGDYSPLFTEKVLEDLFPADRADSFFEAIYGEVSEGAYDIRLEFNKSTDGTLNFQFNLQRRPQKCLRCSLTYGLPKVFVRHPIINIEGLVSDIGKKLEGTATCERWSLGETKEVSPDLHVIPLTIFLQGD
jgi:hypothetical protein